MEESIDRKMDFFTMFLDSDMEWWDIFGTR